MARRDVCSQRAHDEKIYAPGIWVLSEQAGSLDRRSRGLNDLRDLLRMRQERDMARRDLARRRAHPLRVEPFELRVNGPILEDTTYQEGMVFHAAAVTEASKTELLRGFWVAAITRASASGRSLQNVSWNFARSM